MPYWFDYDAHHRILRCRAEGVMDETEFIRYHHAGGLLLNQLAPRAAIMDLTKVTALDVSTNIVRLLAAAPPVVTDPRVLRFVVAPAASIYGIARMYQVLGGEKRPNLTIAHTVEEVYAALGVTAPSFEPIASGSAPE
jgi:hypothetical protein